jgi:hypothetical protein
MPPLNLYARVRFLMQFAHETAGAARTRSSLRLFLEVAPRLFLEVARALDLMGEVCLQNSGVSRRDIADACPKMTSEIDTAGIAP